jgi:hypothetical protein
VNIDYRQVEFFVHAFLDERIIIGTGTVPYHNRTEIAIEEAGDADPERFISALSIDSNKKEKKMLALGSNDLLIRTQKGQLIRIRIQAGQNGPPKIETMKKFRDD